MSDYTLHETRFIPPGKSGWTFGRHIMIRPGLYPGKRQRLIAHESAHVDQYKRHGILKFLTIYVWEYMKGLVRLRNHRKAYLAIPFEIEARIREARI